MESSSSTKAPSKSPKDGKDANGASKVGSLRRNPFRRHNRHHKRRNSSRQSGESSVPEDPAGQGEDAGAHLRQPETKQDSSLQSGGSSFPENHVENGEEGGSRRRHRFHRHRGRHKKRDSSLQSGASSFPEDHANLGEDAGGDHVMQVSSLAGDYPDQIEDPEAQRATLPRGGGQSLSSRIIQGLKSGYAAAARYLSRNCCIIILAFILAAATIALATYLGYFAQKAQPRAAGICMLPSCVHAASEILDNLHSDYESIDPCTDFDQFTCGGWEEKHDLRPDQGDMFTGTLMAERSQMLLRHILEGDASSTRDLLTSDADRNNYDKLKDDYEACMNEDLIRQLGVQPLRFITTKVRDSFPGTASPAHGGVFPIFQNQEQKGIVYDGANQITKTVLYLLRIGVSALVSLGVSGDDRDPDSLAIFIDPLRRVGLPSNEYYDNLDIVSAYKDVITKVLLAFLDNGSGNSSVSAHGRHLTYVRQASLVENLVAFEKKLADASPPPEEQEDVTKYYNPRTLDETRSLLPQISFSYIISTLAPEGFATNRVILGSPTYMKDLSNILRDTSKETLQAYFVWKAVQAYASKIEDPIVTPLKQFDNRLQGKDPDATEERWRTCIGIADNSLGWILSRFFVEKAFSPEAKQFGDMIVSDIKDRFALTLDNTEWMSVDVREKAIEKVRNIVQKIGYPTASPNVMDPEELRSYYAPLEITNRTFFENTFHVREFEVNREWSQLGEPTDRNRWDMTAPTVNAYYNPPGNEIVFPAGIMQSPVFYDPSVPQYLSYGAFGSVGGHELSHAFDSTGRHYDETGNYTDWWDPATVSAFQTRAQCFVDQYSEFTVPNPSDPSNPLHVNGRFTLGENIADAGGVRAAFAAWKRREEEADSPSQLLPGLQNFSKEQLFFISYAGWWCGKTRPEAAAQRIFQDPHAPKWARIRGTMDNSPEFKTAFQCPDREPTCELW